MANIRAATAGDDKCASENWVYVDLGFASEKKTCGLLVGDDEPSTLTFSVLKRALADICKNGATPLNLVLEAPLSVAFRPNGNPVGRFFEKRGKEQRYWYCGPGCSVLIAATYLLRFLCSQQISREVRLFEGFASFKEKGIPSSHKLDVLALRDVVRNLDRTPEGIISAEQIRGQLEGHIIEAICVDGLNLEVPPVVLVEDAI